jgi:FAD/FMN-containing dehydrogenase
MSAARIAGAANSTSRETFDGEPETALWRDRARLSGRHGSGTEVRASWLPASLPAVLALLAQAARDVAVEIELHARAAVGAGTIHIDGDAAACASVVVRLREHPETIGHVVVARAGRDVKDRADVWGPPLASAAISLALKRALDPAGVLNAGRGPI